jgi:putative glycosyltransferase (TIGR04372 family)
MGLPALWRPEGIKAFSWDVVEELNWKQRLAEYLPVRLAEDKRRRAEGLRVDMGISVSNWFVCLHVREEGFHKDAETASNANASIQNYIKGIRLITDAGGWVVRMGDSSMTPLPPMERVIDYPHTPFKSDLMDIYLISECRFFIGTNSGPAEVGRLFHKRMVLTNLFDWSSSIFPSRKGDLAIIKHVFSRSRNRFLSLEDIWGETPQCQTGALPGGDYIMYENSPEEIRDVIEEFLNQPEEYEYSELQGVSNRARSLGMHRWIDQTDFWPDDPLENVVEKYRCAARTDSYIGTLGQRYLEQNWIEDSMNLKMNLRKAAI